MKPEEIRRHISDLRYEGEIPHSDPSWSSVLELISAMELLLPIVEALAEIRVDWNPEDAAPLFDRAREALK